MKINTLFLLLTFFAVVSCTQNKSTTENQKQVTSNQRPKTSDQKQETSDQKQVTSNQRPKTSNQKSTTKHGLTLTLPTTWKPTIDDLKATDLKGNIVSIQSEYKDTDDQSQINIIFHPGEKGKSIYAYKLKKIGKNVKRININNKEAIQTTEILKTDGKGHALKTPTKRIIVSLLTKEGEVDFIINAKSEAAQKNFHDFISKIEY